MANPYGALFAAPGSMAFSAAGFVARMPLSMAGIGIIDTPPTAAEFEAVLRHVLL